MAYTMPGRRDAVDATPHHLDARATSFTHREFELYHFSRSPFARASRSISSASSSSRNMSGRSARSGSTLSKLSVPSASAFAPAIRNLCVYCLHAIDGTSARWRDFHTVRNVAPSNIRASTRNCSFAPVYVSARSDSTCRIAKNDVAVNENSTRTTVSDMNFCVASKEPIAAARHANVYRMATIRAMIVVNTPRGSDAFRALRYSCRT